MIEDNKEVDIFENQLRRFLSITPLSYNSNKSSSSRSYGGCGDRNCCENK